MKLKRNIKNKDKELTQQQTSVPVPTAQSTIHEFDSSSTTTID